MKIYKLKISEIKNILDKINTINTLNEQIRTIEYGISSNIQLICAQNHLKDEWQLDINKKCLIKKETEDATT